MREDRHPSPVTQITGRLLAAVVLLLVGGCANVGYYWQSMNGQLDIWRRSWPVEEVIADPQRGGDRETCARSRDSRIRQPRARAAAESKLPALRRPGAPVRGVDRVCRAGVLRATASLVLFVRRLRELQGLFFEGRSRPFRRGGLGTRPRRIRRRGGGLLDARGTRRPGAEHVHSLPDFQMARLFSRACAPGRTRRHTTLNESFAVAVEREGVRRWLARTDAPRGRSTQPAHTRGVRGAHRRYRDARSATAPALRWTRWGAQAGDAGRSRNRGPHAARGGGAGTPATTAGSRKRPIPRSPSLAIYTGLVPAFPRRC